jgi:hypothetical protein
MPIDAYGAVGALVRAEAPRINSEATTPAPAAPATAERIPSPAGATAPATPTVPRTGGRSVSEALRRPAAVFGQKPSWRG